jgi:hypothetical protein
MQTDYIHLSRVFSRDGRTCPVTVFNHRVEGADIVMKSRGDSNCQRS